MKASKPGSDNVFDDIAPFDSDSLGKGLLIPHYAVEAARIGTWQRNLITNEMTISSMLAGILGLPERQICLSPEEWETLIFPDDMPLIDDALQAAIQTERPIDLEHRLLDRQGRILWVASRGVVSKNEAGKPIRVGGVIVDITEKKISRSRFVQVRNDTGISRK